MDCGYYGMISLRRRDPGFCVWGRLLFKGMFDLGFFVGSVLEKVAPCVDGAGGGPGWGMKRMVR